MARWRSNTRGRRGRRALIGGVAIVAAWVAPPLGVDVAHAVGAQPLSTGLNADGQLGNGTTANRLTPGLVDVPATIVSIASGREHAYALDDSGRVWAWGDNLRGAVGDGTNVDRPTPVRLSLTNVVQVEAGHYHGIALRGDGTVWTWGYGALGQLGLGTTNNRTAPVQVPGLTGVVAVAGGRDMSYAVRVDGTVMAWGGNTYGEVGDGTTTRRVSPVAVSGLDGVVEITGGRNHALVVRANGSVWGWGANERGQLGIGSTVNQTRPVQALAGPAAHVDAGAEHSLAVMIDGSVRSWGRGYRGQLGLGSTANRTTPTTIPGLSGIVDVGDGRDQSFAMNAAGDVWAWGYNDTGQLGDGTTTTRTSPVRIAGLTGIVVAQGGRGMTIFLPGAATDPDVTPPTTPGQPVATSTVAGRVDVSWPASTDDRAASLTYSIYRDGGATPIGSVAGGTVGTISFADIGRTPGAVHTYRVRASDGTNESGLSAASDPVTVAGGGGGTTLLDDDFSSGLTAWSTVGAFTLDGSLGSPASPSARAAVAGAVAYATRGLAASSTDACAAVDVRVTSVSGTARYALMKLRNSGGSSMGRIEVDANGSVQVRADVTGASFTTGASLPFGSWHRVTLCVVAGTSGSLRFELDGSPVGTWNVSTGTLPFASVQLGDNSSRTATVNWDSLVVTGP